MTDQTTLGDRIKAYENTSQSTLLRRTPIIIRVDGRAFHTFTKRLVATRTGEAWSDRKIEDPSLATSPFSDVMHEVMSNTAATLLNQIQNSVFVYTQSDEISILLRDWDRLETQQWFGGTLQKIVSLSASIASTAFNYHLNRHTNPRSIQDLALFDARAFNLPKEEVTNYFIWRQQDASRNSVNMIGRFYFSQKQMHGKSNSQVQDMLMLEHGVNWNDIPTWQKRGICVYQRPDWNSFMSFSRSNIDEDIPIFTQDRQYIERHLSAPDDIITSAGSLVSVGDRWTEPSGEIIQWDGAQWRSIHD
jgi:tRNA(His) 5'-end guanylyltransferase